MNSSQQSPISNRQSAFSNPAVSRVRPLNSRCLIWVRTLLIFIAACLGATKAKASSTDALEQSLKGKYQNQVVMLRGFYCGDRLRFDADGNLLSGRRSGSWTVCRDVRIDGLKITKGKIVIAGHRVYLRYDSQHKEFRDITVDINLAEPNAEKRAKKFEDLFNQQKVVIEMDLPSPADDAALQAAFDKLLFSSEDEFLSSPPELWQHFFEAKDIRPQSNGLVASDKVERVGKNGVTAPRAEYTPDPDYSDEARKAKYQGVTVLDVVVDANGGIGKITLLRPLGMGLDERAAEKISTWRFKPAMKDGNPVAVEMNVEVSFNLY